MANYDKVLHRVGDYQARLAARHVASRAQLSRLNQQLSESSKHEAGLITDVETLCQIFLELRKKILELRDSRDEARQ